MFLVANLIYNLALTEIAHETNCRHELTGLKLNNTNTSSDLYTRKTLTEYVCRMGTN